MSETKTTRKQLPAYLILALIALAAALLLAVTNAITAGPIKAHEEAAQNAAFQSVMTADSFSTMSIPDGCNVTSLVEAKKDGKTIIAGKAGVSFDTDKAREIIGDGSQETYTIPVTITQPSITAETLKAKLFHDTLARTATTLERTGSCGCVHWSERVRRRHHRSDYRRDRHLQGGAGGIQ